VESWIRENCRPQQRPIQTEDNSEVAGAACPTPARLSRLYKIAGCTLSELFINRSLRISSIDGSYEHAIMSRVGKQISYLQHWFRPLPACVPPVPRCNPS
jgi:hypothetical protein